MRARDVPRLGAGLRVLEQRPHARPDPQRPRLAEARHEPLAVVEHLLDLVLGDLGLVGSFTRMSVVPITDTVRIGTRMSPSAGIVQRLITVFTSRWFIAIMIPLPGMISTPSMPAIAATCPAHAPDALSTKRASTVTSSPLRSSCSRAPTTRSPSRRTSTTRW